MHTRIRNCSSIVFALVLAIGSLLVGFGPAVANGLPDATCPSNLNSCTANDVKTTVKAVQILGTCEGGSNDGTACTQTGGQCTLVTLTFVVTRFVFIPIRVEGG